jgi:ABC-type Na+ efflux pump permease subunit
MEDAMRGYFAMLGVVILVMSLVGGSLYLSGSYNTYQARLHETGAQPGSSVTLFDQTKWQFAQVLGGAIIFGGLIFGSLLMGLGWIGKTLEEIRDSLSDDVEPVPPDSMLESRQRSKT